MFKISGVTRFITIYKRAGSSIVQNDAKLILDSNMRCTITELFNAFPITTKEKEDLSCCPEKERSPQLLAHKTMGQLNNGVAQVMISQVQHQTASHSSVFSSEAMNMNKIICILQVLAFYQIIKFVISYI